MMTRYEAWLDKKSLSAIDPSIYILDISYGEPRFTQTATDVPGRNGQRVTNRHAQSTSVTISLEIHEQDTAWRQDVCRRVQNWAAAGGVLTTNDRRGQQLNVVCERFPEIDSALKWTKPIKMVLTAHDQPFWEDDQARTVTLEGTDVSGELFAPGFGAKTRAEARVKNVSGGVIDVLGVQCGETWMAFDALGLGDGQTLEIGHEDGLLFIRVGDVSKMACRSANSSDELMIETGRKETVRVLAAASVSAEISARGLYL